MMLEDIILLYRLVQLILLIVQFLAISSFFVYLTGLLYMSILWLVTGAIRNANYLTLKLNTG